MSDEKAAPPVVAGDIELDAARFHLDEAQARIAALTEALTYYADQFCEFPEMEGCGKYPKDACSGCVARAALKGGKNV